ncbi:MAG TPA: hypothetical protein VGS21_04735 [Acidimicrobiales bacterium]|nr:hypothetical protein [Acidimicrobiales bacterium]
MRFAGIVKVVATLSLVCSAVMWGMTAGAAAPALMLTGDVPTLPTGSGTVLVMVHTPEKIGAHHIPKEFLDTIVAHENISSSRFTIPIPEAALATAAKLGNGFATLNVMVYSGTHFTEVFDSVKMTQPSGAATSTVLLPSLGPFRRIDPASAQAAEAYPAVGHHDWPCVWSIQSTEERTTRVGEVHVAAVKGMTMTFNYSVQADSTIEVGVGPGPSGPYQNAGALTVSNSFGSGATGGYTEPYGGQVGYLGYANDDMYYGQYANNAGVGCTAGYLMNQALSSTGDAYAGPGQPGTNPWKSCQADPAGYARVQAGRGYYNADRGTAVTIGASAWFFGFLGSASTGYTNNINDYYRNSGSADTYVCGSTPPDNAPVLYNSPS